MQSHRRGHLKLTFRHCPTIHILTLETQPLGINNQLNVEELSVRLQQLVVNEWQENGEEYRL